jgi:hypothetical protein
MPLTAGVAVGGAVTVFAPLWAALGTLAALITRVNFEVRAAESAEEAGRTDTSATSETAGAD